MYKIAILGCENSHANSFLDFIIKDKLYTDIEVIGVYSDDIEAAEKLNKEYGVYVAKSFDEFKGKVDGIVVTARHGDNHYKYAKPYIEEKIPMFIDKPITVSEEDARAFRADIEKYNLRVTGGSMCIYADKVHEFKKNVKEETYGRVLGGYLRSPVNMNNPYGDFYFYSQHLVQVMCEIFGYAPLSVIAFENKGVITCTVRYKEYDVNIVFTDGLFNYYLTLNCEKELISTDYGLDGLAKIEFDEFYALLKGEEQKVSLDDFFATVYILNAIDRSLKSGKEEKINF